MVSDRRLAHSLVMAFVLAACSATGTISGPSIDADDDSNNDDDSHTTECQAGYEAVGEACIDIDECQLGTHDCQLNSTCENTAGGFACPCNAGFEPANPETPGPCLPIVEPSPCDFNPCGDGTCAEFFSAYTCSCPAGQGFDGASCQVGVIDACSDGTHTCDPAATCLNSTLGYDCLCHSGFEGDGFVCDDIDECTTGAHSCHIEAVCDNTDGSYTCTCANGYDGSGVQCSDINECDDHSLNNCHDDAQCTNVPGSFSCACNDGYVGSGINCYLAQACDSDNPIQCSVDAGCITNKDTNDSFCTCHSGYDGDGIDCFDIDECAIGSDDCTVGYLCNNTHGGFECECDTAGGYVLVGEVCKADDCASTPCGEHGLCDNTTDSYDCQCAGGFYFDGTTCATDYCSFAPCGANGTCSNILANYSCACDNGYGFDGLTCIVDECPENPSKLTPGDCSCDYSEDKVTYYQDVDGDGRGDATLAQTFCVEAPHTMPAGFVTGSLGLDCDDANPRVWSTCAGGCTDNDGDGYGEGCDLGADCDDANPFLMGTDCTTCIDLDGDLHGQGCALGPDCDDSNPLINPSMVEIPGDGLDNDCLGGDGAFDDQLYVFVAQSDGDDTNVGSQDAPLASLTLGIAMAEASYPRKAVIFDPSGVPLILSNTLTTSVSILAGYQYNPSESAGNRWSYWGGDATIDLSTHAGERLAVANAPRRVFLDHFDIRPAGAAATTCRFSSAVTLSRSYMSVQHDSLAARGLQIDHGAHGVRLIHSSVYDERDASAVLGQTAAVQVQADASLLMVGGEVESLTSNGPTGVYSSGGFQAYETYFSGGRALSINAGDHALGVCYGCIFEGPGSGGTTSAASVIQTVGDAGRARLILIYSEINSFDTNFVDGLIGVDVHGLGEALLIGNLISTGNTEAGINVGVRLSAAGSYAVLANNLIQVGGGDNHSPATYGIHTNAAVSSPGHTAYLVGNLFWGNSQSSPTSTGVHLDAAQGLAVNNTIFAAEGSEVIAIDMATAAFSYAFINNVIHRGFGTAGARAIQISASPMPGVEIDVRNNFFVSSDQASGTACFVRSASTCYTSANADQWPGAGVVLGNLSGPIIHDFANPSGCGLTISTLKLSSQSGQCVDSGLDPQPYFDSLNDTHPWAAWLAELWATDLDDTPRPSNAGPDMGAYEF